MNMRRHAVLITSMLLVVGLAASGSAAPARCAPLVVDDRGDTDPILPKDRQDLDILAADAVTSGDVRRLTFTVTVTSLPDLPLESALYNVYFRAGTRSYLASGHRGLDGEIFRLESDEPTSAGLATVQPITGSFDVAKRTVRLDVPLRFVNDGAKALRRDAVVYAIGILTADSYGARNVVTVGTTYDATNGDAVYRLGARGCDLA